MAASMTPFEKRLARLEAARNIRFQGRRVGVIFDADEADIDAGSLRYKRTREADESPDEFQHRIMAEAAKHGSKVIAMTREEFNEIVASLEEEV
jgi:hypothetical protein